MIEGGVDVLYSPQCPQIDEWGGVDRGEPRIQGRLSTSEGCVFASDCQ